MKKFLYSSVVLLVFAIAASVYVWISIQEKAGTEIPSLPKIMEEKYADKTERQKAILNQPTTTPQDTLPKNKKQTLPEEESTVSSLATQGQKDFAKKFGVDLDTLVITPQTTACAEEKIGVDAVAEIRGGRTPTIREGISLLTCL